MRIVFTGGGTGGHLYPIAAVVRELKRIAEDERILDIQLYYLGPEREAPPMLAAEDVVSAYIPAGKIRRYASIENFIDIARTGWGLLVGLWRMFLIMPDVVFAKGGYGSFPTLAAARIYRLPVVAHESDAVPGRVSRWAGKWAVRVAIAFPGATAYFPQGRAALLGVPVRSRIVGGEREQARDVLGVYSERPVVFVTGGSQGAVLLNRTVIQILPNLLEHYEIIHQTGEKNIEDVRLETMPLTEGGGERYYHPLGSLTEEQTRSAFALADLVVSRAGATSVYEIAANARPAILVPIKISAQDHQRANAYAYAGQGAAVVIEEDNLTPSLLRHEIGRLIADPERRGRMADAARAFARPDAAKVIARELLTIGLH